MSAFYVAGGEEARGSIDQIRLGDLLDEHHAPETNGRMAICRRCGMQTRGPAGGHSPHERQLAQAERWLAAQAVTVRIEALRQAHDT